MAQPTTSPFLPQTVADLLSHVGGIPAERIWLRPAPGTATEQDVVDVHDREDRLCELVDGVLVEKTVGTLEAYLAGLLVRIIGNFVDEHDLGIVLPPDGMLRLAPGLVRIPDASFISWVQLPDHKVPRDPIARLFPDLAIEVLSRGNTKQEMTRKLNDYFASGARLVWYLDPANRTMRCFTSPEKSTLIREGQSLDGGEVLPGFTLPLAQLFARVGD